MCAAKLAGLKHGGDRKSTEVPNDTLNNGDVLAADEANAEHGAGFGRNDGSGECWSPSSLTKAGGRKTVT
jgi:hypothetical protein